MPLSEVSGGEGEKVLFAALFLMFYSKDSQTWLDIIFFSNPMLTRLTAASATTYKNHIQKNLSFPHKSSYLVDLIPLPLSLMVDS